MKFIKLTQGYKSVIDDEDFEFLSQHSWYVKHKSDDLKYAFSRVSGRLVGMHQSIMGDPPIGMEIDHIDWDGLNNQKENLRFIDHNVNMHRTRRRNSSGYIGVFANNGSWMARIGVEGKPVYLGTFKDPKDAARAYDEAAIEVYGEFANTNGDKGLV